MPALANMGTTILLMMGVFMLVGIYLKLCEVVNLLKQR